MHWEKKGLIYAPTGEKSWARSHAHVPTAYLLNDDVIRVYFAALDDHKFGRIGYVDLDASEPQRVLGASSEPVLDLGPLGSFDDSGVTPSCVIKNEDKHFLYYIGWQRAERVPYMLFSGLAVSENKGSSFTKYSRVPILDRTEHDPYSRSAPCVLKDDGRYKAWYWSCAEWSNEDGWIHYNNVICLVESPDGIHWNEKPQICITASGPEVYAVGRPWVVKDGDLYRMWYSVRSRSAKHPYTIAYAESRDGLTWLQKPNEVGIQVSDEGWDSEMICHACVIETANHDWLMFYNGNRHGEAGFGCAILKS